MRLPMMRRLALGIVAAAAIVAPGSARAATVFTLTGHGWGHGIGMSQYGALGYAEHGYGYKPILTHYFTGTHVGPLPRSVRERVLLSQGSAVHFGASAAMRTVDAAGTRTGLAAGSYRVVPGGRAGHLQIVNRTSGAILKGIVAPLTISPRSQPLRLDDSAGIGFAGDHWHGSFRIDESGQTLLCIDVVALEKYARGVVPSEMPSSWPLPALKAQAVAARSYAVATRNPSGAFDAYADTRSQVYGPIEHEAAASTTAVADTAHQVVWYGHSVATTFFSSSSGGRTSSEQAAWDTTSGEPYLVPVVDRYDSANGANPYHTWPTVTYTPRRLAEALGLSGVVGAVAMTIDGPSDRVLQAAVTSSAGTSTLTGSQVLGRMGLRSTFFRLLQRTLVAPRTSAAGTVITITGRAWPVPSGGVTLERRGAAGTAWRAITPRLHVGRKGNFVTTMAPVANRFYRLASAGRAVSPMVLVHVQPVLTLTVTGGRFHAAMSPAVPGATLDLEQYTAGGWPVVESATAGRHGHAVFATAPGSGQWRIHFGGDAAHTRGHSATLTIP